MLSTRTQLAALTLLLAAPLALPATAGAPAAPPQKGDVEYQDPTPDPTGNTNSGNQNHCNGLLPMEPPYIFNAPTTGKLAVKIDGFQGDWTLQIRDAKDKVIAGDDVNPPATEATTVKVKAKGQIKIQPCNIGFTPIAMIHWTFTPDPPKKK